MKNKSSIGITDEPKLKMLLKAAVVEVLEERRDLIRDAVAEAVEDLGMIQAIKEGSRSASVSRDAVIRILRKRRSRPPFRPASLKIFAPSKTGACMKSR